MINEILILSALQLFNIMLPLSIRGFSKILPGTYRNHHNGGKYANNADDDEKLDEGKCSAHAKPYYIKFLSHSLVSTICTSSTAVVFLSLRGSSFS